MRGFSLGIVLVLGMVCMSIALLVSSMAVFQLDAAQTARAREQALHLAEAALAQTVNAEWTDLTQNPMQTYGVASDGVKFIDPSDAGNFGQTTFDTSSLWGYCTNNCSNGPNGGNNTAGWGGVAVPASSCYVVARGVVGSTTVRIEAMLAAPPFQFALACQGPVSATNALIVKAEPTMGALATDTGLLSSMAANVGSNTSVTAGSNSLVTGDVVASGPVDLSAPSLVDGVIRPGTISPPTFDIPSYDNSGANPATLDTSTHPVVVSQNTYFNGPLTINGELKLQNATLYVQGGPVTINGALDGTGALIVNGNVTLNGGADLDAATLVALLSSGDVALNGPPSGQKYFQGLVYCDGAFSASYITIAGAFVSAPGAGSTATDSGLLLGPGTQVVYVPAAANIQGTPPLPPGPSAAQVAALLDVGGRNYLDGSPDSVSPDAWNQPNPAPSSVPWVPTVTLPDPNCSANQTIYNAVNAAMSSNPILGVQALNAGASQTRDGVNYGITPAMSGFNTAVPDIFLTNASWLQGLGTATVTSYTMQCYSIQYDPVTARFVPITPPLVYYGVQPTSGPPAYTGLGTPTLITAAQFDTGMQGNAAFSSVGGSSASMVAFFEAAQTAYMNAANPILQNPTSVTPSGPSTPGSVPNLTLNNFLSSPSPLHLVSWREEP